MSDPKICDCEIPDRHDCEQRCFPPGCYYASGDDAETEKNAINDALGGFDNYALGYRVPNR